MDLQGSRLLLVGGAGLIGSHIAGLLVEEDVIEFVEWGDRISLNGLAPH